MCCTGKKYADLETFPISELAEDVRNCYDFSPGAL